MTSTPHYDEANLLQSTVGMAPVHRSSISFSISSCASESTAVIVQQISQSSASSSLSLSIFRDEDETVSASLEAGLEDASEDATLVNKQTLTRETTRSPVDSSEPWY